jgi:hypothetical protein
MNKTLELDLLVAGKDIGRALAEIVFVTVHAEMVGSHRQETAVQTFSEVLLRYVQLAQTSAAEEEQM